MNGSFAIFFRKVFSLFGALTSGYLLLAQTGSPLLSHYRESNEVENQSWAICQDDNDIMMFANRRGILTFDGQSWNFVRIPVIPYAMIYKPEIKTVYIGSENSYGYLERDEKGLYNYHTISPDSSDIGIITGIYPTDTTLWFYGETGISCFNLNTGRQDLLLKSKNGKPFSGMIITPRNIFVNVQSDGLYRLDSDTLFPIVTGYLLKEREILFFLPYNSKLTLIGLDDGKLALFDGIKFYDYPVKDEGYLQQNYLSGGIVLSDSLYAFSTLDGGAIVVEKNSGKVIHTINYTRGLPDDEIFAVGKDNDGGLWLSHQYGLTRADLLLPANNFTIYPGLKGNLTGSLFYNNELYVATSEGVFYLAEEKQYMQVEVIVREETYNINAGKPLIPAVQQLPAGTIEKEQPSVQASEKTRRGILLRIFRKKTTQQQQVDLPEKVTDHPEIADTVQIRPIQESKPHYVKKTVSRLKSVNYSFRKVSGLDEKCRQMITTPAGILASTNRGLMIITSHSARQLVHNRYIYSIYPGNDGKSYWVSSPEGYFSISYISGEWKVGETDPGFRSPVYSVVPVGDSLLWLGMDESVARVNFSGKPEYDYYKMKDDFPQRYSVDYVNDTLFVFSESGIKYFNREKNIFQEYGNIMETKAGKIKFILSQPGIPWFFNGEEWICLNQKVGISSGARSTLKVFDEIISIFSGGNTIWVISGGNQIFRIECERIRSLRKEFSLFVKSITNEKGNYFRLSDVVFGSNDNNIYFELASPSYIKQRSTQYQYIVDRVMDDWSKWSSGSMINLMLQPGKYTLKVRAKDIWGNISEPESVNFTIKTPFTRTAVFYILVSVAALMAVAAIMRFRERRLQVEKLILEEKVRERTAEIEAQKEEITSSIAYAGRIQSAMLPSEEIFRNLFADYFLIFMPRNIVSGDFYWIAEDEKCIYFTVADCTGHGVPGAFMSTLGISALNEIITNNMPSGADTILNLLRRKIIDSLHQTGREGEAADGMDISFCILDKKRTTLSYAGAFNPLIIVSDGDLKEYKADKMPIGIHVGKEEPFSNNIIKVKRGDVLYLFSDGITDQFGGPEGKKYKKSGFKKLLFSIHHLPMAQQKEMIENEYFKWKGNTEQVDDITIIGVRI